MTPYNSVSVFHSSHTAINPAAKAQSNKLTRGASPTVHLFIYFIFCSVKLYFIHFYIAAVSSEGAEHLKETRAVICSGLLT